MELAKKHGMAYVETSAKSGEGVNEAFRTIAKKVKDRLQKAGAGEPAASRRQPDTVPIYSRDAKEKKGCCK